MSTDPVSSPVQGEAAEGECPWCPDGHEAPERRPWGAYVDYWSPDGDGQPVRIIVAKAAGQHVAESDVEWLRELIRAANSSRPAAVPTAREGETDELNFRGMLLSAIEEYAHDLQEQITEGYFDRREVPLALSVVTSLRSELQSGDCRGCHGLGYLALDDEAVSMMPNGSYETCATCSGTGGAHRWM